MHRKTVLKTTCWISIHWSSWSSMDRVVHSFLGNGVIHQLQFAAACHLNSRICYHHCHQHYWSWWLPKSSPSWSSTPSSPHSLISRPLSENTRSARSPNATTALVCSLHNTRHGHYSNWIKRIRKYSSTKVNMDTMIGKNTKFVGM